MRSNLFPAKGLYLSTSLAVLTFLSACFSYGQTLTNISNDRLKNLSGNATTLAEALKNGNPLTETQRSLLQQKLDRMTEQQGSRMGTKDGGGGDALAFEFQSAAQQALRNLQGIVPNTFTDVSQRNIGFTIENAKIIFVDQSLDVEINALIQSSVAFNSPKTQTILVNRHRWNLLNESLKETIALHEFLSLVRLESTGSYSISSQLWTALSTKDALRSSDEGVVPQVVYVCTTSSRNMIGIGVRYQISLAENSSQVIYSEYSMGNIQKEVIASEIGRTHKVFPATVKIQGAEYYIESRLYNTEDSSFRLENAILDTKNDVLKIVMPDGRLTPISCKLVAK